MYRKKRAGVNLGVVMGIIAVAFILISNVAIKVENEGGLKWRVIWSGNIAQAEYNPGSGASGFLEIFAINHTTTPQTTYNRNDSSVLEGWCNAHGLGYADTDDFNVQIASEVAFDFVVRARFNRTHAWDGEKFVGSRCRVRLWVNSTDWLDGENISYSMPAEGYCETRNDTSEQFIWINYYWNANDDQGYQLRDDGTITVDKIIIEAKF